MYLQSLGAGQPNLATIQFNDEFDNPVYVPASRMVVLASYTTQPSPQVVTLIDTTNGSNVMDIYIFVNRTGQVSLRISIDSEPDNPFYSVVATVTPAVYSSLQTYALVSFLTTTQPPFTMVDSTAGIFTIQPWYRPVPVSRPARRRCPPPLFFLTGSGGRRGRGEARVAFSSASSDTFGNHIKPSFVDPVNAAQFTCDLVLAAPSNGYPEGTVVSSATSVLNAPSFSTATAYTCSYGPVTLAGNYTLSVRYGGTQHIQGSPYNVYVIPGDVDGPSSYLVGVNANATKVVGQLYSFTIVTRVCALPRDARPTRPVGEADAATAMGGERARTRTCT